jgi:hypothetical protein
MTPSFASAKSDRGKFKQGERSESIVIVITDTQLIQEAFGSSSNYQNVLTTLATAEQKI